jgi:ABC-type dipeptide/oligopeptide/nickel transport system ATPase component
VGDGCNLPTYDDIVYNNNGVSSFVKRQQLMGLVSRGGCSWSTKINNLQALTQTNSIFKITGVLIYDNVIYNDTVAPIIQSKPSFLMTSQWHSSQLVPTQRNISMMQDNDLPSSTLSPFMAIYFASHQFGLDLLAKMNGSQSTAPTSNNGAKQYVRLAPYFNDSVQEDNPANSNNSNNGNDNNEGNGTDSSSMDADELFGGGNRGYIAYLVAAVAGIVMGMV